MSPYGYKRHRGAGNLNFRKLVHSGRAPGPSALLLFPEIWRSISAILSPPSAVVWSRFAFARSARGAWAAGPAGAGVTLASCYARLPNDRTSRSRDDGYERLSSLTSGPSRVPARARAGRCLMASFCIR
jgi:hypothetical protein